MTELSSLKMYNFSLWCLNINGTHGSTAYRLVQKSNICNLKKFYI